MKLFSIKFFFITTALVILIPAARASAQVKGVSAPMRLVAKHLPGESEGPMLTLIQPIAAGGQLVTVTEPSQRIVVEASDDNGISEVLINDRKSSTNDGKLFFTDVSLKGGENIISIKARDARGNISTKSFNMTWLSTITPPIISINFPPPGKSTKIVSRQEVISVKGTALSLNGLKTITVNGQRAKLEQDGSFSAEVRLIMGDNTLIIKAADNRGNTSSDTFFVTRK